MSNSLVNILPAITSALSIYLPLIFIIFGIIGFIGNLFTYTQRALRSNTCCIYSLVGSIVDVLNLLFGLLPNGLTAAFGIVLPWTQTTPLCKFSVFLIVFLPHLSANCLLFAIIDRYAATCALQSRLRRMVQLKLTPIIIILAILISFLCTMYNLFYFESFSSSFCISNDPLTPSILYIIFVGLSQPIVMLVFVLLTQRNVHQSHRRIVSLRFFLSLVI